MITKERIKELEAAELKLLALEGGGVDNWEGYDFALEEYYKDIEEEEKIDALFEEIETAFFEGAYEPSERGAGIAPGDDARDNAKDIFMKYIRENK
jgi:hypothetical protein